ncbi:hypothetical protein AZ78_1941 [Lysobacter capsici AZ78]|uniref:Uncharacterized protein n=1 Tax=Lysobacter capsici AZ78 TaxID=1444315 RepID=A0A108U893_9GAMM|nr:hypothetical protein AZ78_1941 [Lysobacter capsici AZ78]
MASPACEVRLAANPRIGSDACRRPRSAGRCAWYGANESMTRGRMRG